MFSRFFFSYRLIVDRIVELLTRSENVENYQIKGCLYILLGNDSFFILTKHSWTVLEKLWPAIIQTSHINTPSTIDLLNSVNEKIYKTFNTVSIFEENDENTRRVAAELWRPLTDNEIDGYKKIHEEKHHAHRNLYYSLMGKLTSMIKNDNL